MVELQRSVEAKIEVAFTFMQQRSIGLLDFIHWHSRQNDDEFERQIPC